MSFRALATAASTDTDKVTASYEEIISSVRSWSDTPSDRGTGCLGTRCHELVRIRSVEAGILPESGPLPPGDSYHRTHHDRSSCVVH